MPTCLMTTAPAEGGVSHRSLPTRLQSRPTLALQDGRPESQGGLIALIMDILSDGVVLADRSGRVIYVNRSAQELVARRLLAIRNGQLWTASPHETRKLHALISASLRDSEAGAHMRMGTRLLVTISALGTAHDLAGPQGAVILLRDLETPHVPSLASIIAYFGLTPAEARLAQEIIRGDGLARCARRLGTRITTVRSHLRHIFEKTETKGQAHLVGLLLRCGACIAEPHTTFHPASGHRDRARPRTGL